MHPPQAFEPLQAGDPPLVGGYRVLARLGAGGMGRVLLATTQSGRRLAVKVVRPEFAGDPGFRRRFQQEIAAAQRVRSPYTAEVVDAHPDAPAPWMATAFVAGPSLARAVAEHGPMPGPTLRVLFAGIAEALAAVHTAGMIHRDLKPSNVLLAADGPRVVDFGISRATDSTPLTRTDVRVGSPQFMAPEQALDHDPTPALDVFALGSVMYFAATGRTPFGEGPDTAVLSRVAHEEPNLDDCPDDLRALVEQCLAKDPSERPTPRQVLTALEADEGVPDPDWLPEDVRRVLPSYAGEPPRPVPPEGQAPTTPYTSYMPAGTTPPGAQPPRTPGTPPAGPGTPPPAPGGPPAGPGAPSSGPGTLPPPGPRALATPSLGGPVTLPPGAIPAARPPASGMAHPPGVPPRPVHGGGRNTMPLLIGAVALGAIMVLVLVVLAFTSAGTPGNHLNGGTGVQAPMTEPSASDLPSSAPGSPPDVSSSPGD
ncbi:serine/threonine-protein kinase [Spirillospora sp. NPDC052269]